MSDTAERATLHDLIDRLPEEFVPTVKGMMEALSVQDVERASQWAAELSEQRSREDREDLIAAREALAEARKEGTIPWETVKKEAGLTP